MAKDKSESRAESGIADIAKTKGMDFGAAHVEVLRQTFDVQKRLRKRMSNRTEKIGAKAHTLDRGISFGDGKFGERNPAGGGAMPHEATHTLQQGGSKKPWW